MSTQPKGGCACGAVATRVEMLGSTPQPVDVPRDDGRAQRIYRCPSRQIALFSEYGRPGLWFVRAGTLDDPTRVAPDVHIYTRSKVGWVTLPEATPAFAEYYDPSRIWPADSLRRLDAITRPVTVSTIWAAARGERPRRHPQTSHQLSVSNTWNPSGSA